MDWFGCPKLPKPCRCGKSDQYLADERCTEIGLRNHYNFPPFRDLQDINGLDEAYYTFGQALPHRHWAFVGEVVEDRTDWVRPRFMLRSHYNEDVLVNFHLEDIPFPTYFAFEDVRVGHTMCILYAERKVFLDTNSGIRQEGPRTPFLFPVNLDLVSEECELHEKASDPSSLVCFGCKRDGPTKRCARCRTAWYCSKECQVQHWIRAHKKLCPHAQRLRWLVSIDFASFHGFLGWDDYRFGQALD